MPHEPKEGDRSTWIDRASGEAGPCEFRNGDWRERAAVFPKGWEGEVDPRTTRELMVERLAELRQADLSAFVARYPNARAAATDLGIGRSTLFAYLKNEQPLPRVVCLAIAALTFKKASVTEIGSEAWLLQRNSELEERNVELEDVLSGERIEWMVREDIDHLMSVEKENTRLSKEITTARLAEVEVCLKIVGDLRDEHVEGRENERAYFALMDATELLAERYHSLLDALTKDRSDAR